MQFHLFITIRIDNLGAIRLIGMVYSIHLINTEENADEKLGDSNGMDVRKILAITINLISCSHRRVRPLVHSTTQLLLHYDIRRLD